MKVILTFIINHCLFLFESYGFRFIDSLYSKSFGGDAYVTLESENMQIRFIYDRAQLLLDFSSNKGKKPVWYSVDLISQLITGKIESSSLLDSHYAKFLKENFDEIIQLFSEKNVDSTIQELKKLAKERAKRLFG